MSNEVFIEAVVAVIRYISVSDVTIDSVVASKSRRLESFYFRMDHHSLSSSATIFTYTLQLRNASLSFDRVSSQLKRAVMDGSFDSYLVANSVKHGIQTFNNVTSGSIEVTDLGVNSSSISSSPIPSIEPSVEPTASPSINPSSLPTYTSPSINPSSIPTINSKIPSLIPSLILAAPSLTEPVKVPIISNQTLTSLDRSISIKLLFSFAAAYAGEVYCAALQGVATSLASINQIMTTGTRKVYLVGDMSVVVPIHGLKALTNYSTYCYLVNVDNVGLYFRANDEYIQMD